MKITILIALFTVSIHAVSAQCAADAGNNIHLCSQDTVIQLGGNPTAIGGKPPFTYKWWIDPVPTGSQIIPFLYASNFLDDTTIANPSLLNRPDNIDPFAIYLSVTDSIGCISYDTIIVTSSLFGIHLTTWEYHIYQGDSVYLNEVPNVDCIDRPCTYLWSPSHGLSDSTLLGGFWAKPDSNIVYRMTATDDKGCSKTGSAFYYVYVRPVGIENLNTPSSVRIFPNPTKDIINIEPGNNIQIQHIKLFDLNGQEIGITKTDYNVDLSNVMRGVYVLKLQTNKEMLQFRIFKL